jgi:hypothetical protein
MALRLEGCVTPHSPASVRGLGHSKPRVEAAPVQDYNPASVHNGCISSHQKGVAQGGTQMLGNLMNALMQPGPQGQQSAGAQMLSQVVGGVLGGQQGGAPVSQLLSGLEQIIGGNPSSGGSLGQGTQPPASSPLMSLLGPVANAVAGQVGVSPAVATTVAATAMHYLVSSHPASGVTPPASAGNLAQQVASGNISPAVLHSSGMVNAVVQATGMSKDDAAKTLGATFNAFQEHAKQHAAKDAHRRKRNDDL